MSLPRMELTQPAILTLIDYLYTGCIQASSYVAVKRYLLKHRLLKLETMLIKCTAQLACWSCWQTCFNIVLVQELVDLAKAAEYFQLKSVVRWLDSIIRLSMFNSSQVEKSKMSSIMGRCTYQREHFPLSDVLEIPGPLSHGASGAS